MATRKTHFKTDETVEQKIARKVLLASADAWRPAPGDTLINPTVVGVRIGGIDSQYGTYPILVIETASGGVLAIHAFHTLLRNRLAEIKPTPGTVIESITYVGEKITNDSKDKDPKNQTTYHHYVITMAGDEDEDGEFEFTAADKRDKNAE